MPPKLDRLETTTSDPNRIARERVRPLSNSAAMSSDSEAPRKSAYAAIPSVHTVSQGGKRKDNPANPTQSKTAFAMRDTRFPGTSPKIGQFSLCLSNFRPASNLGAFTAETKANEKKPSW